MIIIIKRTYMAQVNNELRLIRMAKYTLNRIHLKVKTES